jgi:protein involved in polysaccharide export with SLBB domain
MKIHLHNYIQALVTFFSKGLAGVFVLGIFTIGTQQSLAQDSGYLLGTNDVIAISVYDEEDLSFEEIRIADSGRINYPLLGEIVAVGVSVSGFEQSIRKRLIDGEYLIDPTVAVRIVEYRPFYIDGQVEEPGSYPFEPNLTLRKAISIAGGFTERASRSKINILAEGVDPQSDSLQVENLDVSIGPGDIITVGERLF